MPDVLVPVDEVPVVVDWPEADDCTCEVEARVCVEDASAAGSPTPPPPPQAISTVVEAQHSAEIANR